MGRPSNLIALSRELLFTNVLIKVMRFESIICLLLVMESLMSSIFLPENGHWQGKCWVMLAGVTLALS